jgi:glutathione S-transferase
MDASNSASAGADAAAAAAPPPSLVVYWGSGSPPAWRVLLTLHEKQLPYRSQLVSFESGALKKPPMLALNPRGLVPVLLDGARGVCMHESLAIMHYLETFYGDAPLLPADGQLRARALTRMQEANNVSSAAGEVVYYVRRTPPENIDANYLQVKRSALTEEMQLWETYLAGTLFLAGGGITLADLSFFPSLAYMLRLGFSLERFPNLLAYFHRMCERKSVLATWPPHWKEVPGLPILRW